MRVTVKDKEILLSNAEVKLCRKQISQLLTSVRKATKDGNRISYYFTFLIMMHVMSQELLNGMDPETLQDVMRAFYTEN